jgi:nicotinate-nucleotide pyrophosphorylase (carboxylating)
MLSLNEIIQLAIKEDIGNGDYTSLACVPADATGKAKLLAKQEGIIAGVEVAKEIFNTIDSTLIVRDFLPDGYSIHPGDIIFEVEGSAQSILKAERLVLNCMQRMSGIATYTHYLASIIKDYPTQLLDTRKTTPNFRLLEKMAVAIGGGVNHRFGLDDMMMIKDNHIDYAGGIKKAIDAANEFRNKNNLTIPLEIEARNLDELEEILAVGNVDRIMLDNFSFDDMRKAIALINGKYQTEASGGINETTILEYAKCGVDYISVGALTHQIKSLDLSLKAF